MIAQAAQGAKNFAELFNAGNFVPLLKTALLLVVGIPLSYRLSRKVSDFLTIRYSAHHGLIARQGVFWGLLILFCAAAMAQLGFSLTPLLGAAGVIGVAVGFASQTSVSNIISGLFILAEQPFAVGDVITVKDTTGVVLTIDLLSIKIRTFDNKYVRIPNETILKSKVTNITRFPIRRVDVEVAVAYKEDVARVKEVLIEVASQDSRILKQPAPLVFFRSFGESKVNLLFLVWAETTEWFPVRNSLPEAIKVRFDREGIDIPWFRVKVFKGEFLDERAPVQKLDLP